jgi:hypothetical protein
MWKHCACLLAFVALVLPPAGCGGSPGPVEAALGRDFSLAVGQQASITGESLGIRFEAVVGDSRCPQDVTCPWAGEVTCTVLVTRGNSSYSMALTEPGLSSSYATERYQDYELSFHVEPYPRAGQAIPANEYRLKLVVDKP